MKKILIYSLFVVVLLPAVAQNQYNAILMEIEKNSTTLKALRDQMEADKLSNQTGIYPANPEFEFHYLWGNPSTIGNRIDINVTQSFDFPTVYRNRSKIANIQIANADLMYKSEKINLMLSAKQICVELIYNNALAKEYIQRLKNAESIAESYKKRLEKGDVNIIENNKAQLNLMSVRNEMSKIEIECKNLLLELKRLNGGNEIVLKDSSFSAYFLPTNFEEWYAEAESKSPMLQYISGQIELCQQQLKLNKASVLPKFTAGYMSEKATTDQFQGVVLGLSLPLWENKNQIKQAKAQVKASEMLLEDNKVQFYNRFKNLYEKALNTQKAVSKYKESLSMYNNEALLKKALDAGEISLLTYLLEIEYYYETVNKILEAEKDFGLLVAELETIKE